MKSFAFFLVAVAVLVQNADMSVIRTGPCDCSPPLLPCSALSAPVYATVAQPSVASSLADTLSLLTVSSLLAESLPLNPNVVAAVPVPVPLACGGCGCGGCDGCGWDGYGCGGCGWDGCGCGGYNGHWGRYLY